MKIIIVGAGGHGQVVADILLSNVKIHGAEAHPIGFVDDDTSLHQRTVLGLPVFGTVAQLPMVEHDAVIIAVGKNHTRKQIYRRLQTNGESLATAIHPSAVVSSEVTIGEGTVVGAGVVIGTGSKIGRNAILNTGCTIDHHNVLADHVHVAPGVHIGGDVHIGEGTLIGIGATILPQHRVGAWSVVGAGAVAIKNVPSYTTVLGVPARVIKKRDE